MNLEVLRGALFDANCYVMWLPGASEALVVDPGPGTATQVAQVLSREGLTPGAVLLTHGHIDHVWEVAQVAGDAPVFIPAGDAFMLEDPAGLLGLRGATLGLGEWVEPANVVELGAETFNPLPGLAMRVVPAPGHSPGSALFLFSPTPGDGPAALSGDVIFAGSIGRSDLPGGDAKVMDETLRTLVDVVDPATILFPGHGPQTQWGHEQSTNPFVRAAQR